jgi:putative phosphoesterase
VTTRILATGDTHVPDFARHLPASLLRRAEKADLILHAGDVTSADVLQTLADLAPVRVALGNNDDASVVAFGAEDAVELAVEGVRLAMLHDAGRRTNRERRLARRFPAADVLVFGHSHIPMITALDGRRFLNPGSPTWKRRALAATCAVLTIDERRTRIRLVDL